MDTSRSMLAVGLVLVGIWAWATDDPFGWNSDARNGNASAGEPASAAVPAAEPDTEAEFDGGEDLSISAPDGLLSLTAGHSAHTTFASFSDDEADSSGRAHFHPHGETVCASGCAPSSHPTDELSRVRFRGLLEQYATGPLDGTNLALETLLYYGPQSAAHLTAMQAESNSEGEAEGKEASELESLLKPSQITFLEQQLRRNKVSVEVRIVDEHGQVRADLPATSVPLDRRHVFELDEHGIQPMVVSGTVKRVGLDHLWTRL